MEKIDQIRRDIDRIDEATLKLLVERIAETRKIGRIKEKTGRVVYDPARETSILAKLQAKSGRKIPPKNLRAIYQEIFNCCRSLEQPMAIAYLGPEATFTYQAALNAFGPTARLLAERSVDSVFDAVEKGLADYGVVPIENTTEGVVNHTLDIFIDSELKIVREIMLPVRHQLLSSGSLARIRHVYSHPQALPQCEKWLENNLPRAIRHETESTAAAVKKVAGLANAAAIASETASLMYGVPVIVRDIHDFSRNMTRFLVVGQHYSNRSGRDRTSILFSIRDRIGALQDMLIPFSREDLNLTRIESRPTKRRAWEYVFFIDFLGYMDDPPVKKALGELEKMCLFLKILGSYPVADEP